MMTRAWFVAAYVVLVLVVYTAVWLVVSQAIEEVAR